MEVLFRGLNTPWKGRYSNLKQITATLLNFSSISYFLTHPTYLSR
jgi:hypothetical protein